MSEPALLDAIRKSRSVEILWCPLIHASDWPDDFEAIIGRGIRDVTGIDWIRDTCRQLAGSDSLAPEDDETLVHALDNAMWQILRGALPDQSEAARDKIGLINDIEAFQDTSILELFKAPEMRLSFGLWASKDVYSKTGLPPGWIPEINISRRYTGTLLNHPDHLLAYLRSFSLNMWQKSMCLFLEGANGNGATTGWLYEQLRIVPLAFSSVDFIDQLPWLAAKLKQPPPGDNISRFLQPYFSDNTRALLQKYAGGFGEDLRASLAQDLTQAIKGDLIYDEQLFGGVLRSKETETLVAKKLQGKNLVRLNRLLLEDAYRSQIRRRRDIRFTATGPLPRRVWRLRTTHATNWRTQFEIAHKRLAFPCKGNEKIIEREMRRAPHGLGATISSWADEASSLQLAVLGSPRFLFEPTFRPVLDTHSPENEPGAIPILLETKALPSFRDVLYATYEPNPPSADSHCRCVCGRKYPSNGGSGRCPDDIVGLRAQAKKWIEMECAKGPREMARGWDWWLLSSPHTYFAEDIELLRQDGLSKQQHKAAIQKATARWKQLMEQDFA